MNSLEIMKYFFKPVLKRYARGKLNCIAYSLTKFLCSLFVMKRNKIYPAQTHAFLHFSSIHLLHRHSNNSNKSQDQAEPVKVMSNQDSYLSLCSFLLIFVYYFYYTNIVRSICDMLIYIVKMMFFTVIPSHPRIN